MDCHCALSLYTVPVHCPCCHCLLSLYMVHCIVPLYVVTAQCRLSLYIVTVQCTLSTVLCTLYPVLPKVSKNVSPHTFLPPERPRLRTSTLHCHCTLTVCSHCTLSLYTVTVPCHCKLGAIFLERVYDPLSPPLCTPLTRHPPPHSHNPKNSFSQSESCNCSLRHSQGNTH